MIVVISTTATANRGNFNAAAGTNGIRGLRGSGTYPGVNGNNCTGTPGAGTIVQIQI